MIGAVIHMSATARTLTMQGHTWDLLNLDRHATEAVAGLVSDAMGLDRSKPAGRRRGRKASSSRARTIHN